MAIKVTVGWTNPDPNTNLDHLEVWRKLGEGGTYAQVGADITDITQGEPLEFEDTNSGDGFEVGDEYFYQVRAYNATGEYSNVEGTITIVSTEYVLLDNTMVALQGTMAYTAGPPRYFQATTASDCGAVIAQYLGAFDIKVMLKDTYSKSIAITLDDDNTPTNNGYGSATITVKEDLSLSKGTIVGGASAIDVPTTITMSTANGNYLRMSRTGSAASGSIYVHYFNGTSEALVHTFAPQATGTYLKFLTAASRRLFELQIK